MNIVVCVKYVPDTNLPVEADARTGTIDCEDTPCVINPGDMLAFNEALGIKRKFASATVTVVSLGTGLSKKAMRKCFSLGADSGVLVRGPAGEGLDGLATAFILARTIKTMKYDLILCGVQAADTCCGQVGPAIAQMLGVPLVNGVTAVDISPDLKYVSAQRKLERGNREIVESGLPVLLTVEATSQAAVYPSLPMMIAAQRRPIDERDISDIGLTMDDVRGNIKMKTLKISPSRPRIKKPFTPDSSLPYQERMRLIMSGGIKEKEGSLLQGSPADVAAGLVRYLVQQKLVKKTP